MKIFVLSCWLNHVSFFKIILCCYAPGVNCDRAVLNIKSCKFNYSVCTCHNGILGFSTSKAAFPLLSVVSCL